MLTIRFEVVDLALQQVSIVVAVGFAQQIEFVTVRPPYKPIPPLTENCCLLLHDVDTLVKLMYGGSCVVCPDFLTSAGNRV